MCCSETIIYLSALVVPFQMCKLLVLCIRYLYTPGVVEMWLTKHFKNKKRRKKSNPLVKCFNRHAESLKCILASLCMHTVHASWTVYVLISTLRHCYRAPSLAQCYSCTPCALCCILHGIIDGVVGNRLTLTHTQARV